jgi:hypothetical protein
MQKTMRVGPLIEFLTLAVTKAGLDPIAYEIDTLEDLMESGWRFKQVGDRLFEAKVPNGIKIGQFTPDELFWAECGYKAVHKKGNISIGKWGPSDRAALTDPMLGAIIRKGWLIFGVEEALFDTETPNGVPIGPMTANEIVAADCGYQAGLSGLA